MVHPDGHPGQDCRQAPQQAGMIGRSVQGIDTLPPHQAGQLPDHPGPGGFEVEPQAHHGKSRLGQLAAQVPVLFQGAGHGEVALRVQLPAAISHRLLHPSQVQVDHQV